MLNLRFVRSHEESPDADRISRKTRETMTEMTFRVPESLAQLLEEWAKRIPEMELVSKICHTDTREAINSCVAVAIREMREYGAFRYPGYYTYIMIAANEGLIPGMPFFFSPQEFVDYLKVLDLDGLPGRSTIYDTISKVSGRYPDWTFNDQPKAAEELRRKNIVKQFLSAFGRAKRRLSDGFSENR